MPKAKTAQSRAETTEQLAPSGAGNKENSLLQFDVRIQSIRPRESIKGTASVNINGAFAIRGVKIIEGSNGLFVSMPSYKVGNEYKDICFPITQECRKQLHEAVIGAYEQAISQGQDTVAKHHGMQAPDGQPMEIKLEEKDMRNMMKKAAQNVKAVAVRAGMLMKDTKGENYVDTAVKILIAVVLGALLLAGLYALFGDVVMPTLTQRIQDMFNYAG